MIYKSTNPNFSKYYYDSEVNAIFSTKSGHPYKLAWSRDRSGRYRTSVGDRNYYKTSIRQDQVMKYFTLPQGVVAQPQANVTSNGFIIGSRVGGTFSFASTPRVHSTITEARTEAERLAKANPGKKFVLVSIVGAVQATGVSWE